MTEAEASLATMRRGEVIQRFDMAMAEVAADILDPEKEATATRKVTLVVSIKPNDRRDTATATIEVKMSLPSPKPEQTLLYVGQSRGVATFAEHDARQTSIFDEIEEEVTHD